MNWFLKHSEFKIIPGGHTQANHGYDKLTAVLNGRPVGEIYYYNRYPSTDVKIDFVGVDESVRGRHVAQRLYQEFVNQMRRKYPWVKRIIGDVHSQRVLNVKNSILGQPESIDNNVDLLTLPEAMKILPPTIREEDKKPQFYGNNVTTVHKMPKRIRRKDLIPFKPFYTQPELPFEQSGTA